MRRTTISLLASLTVALAVGFVIAGCGSRGSKTAEPQTRSFPKVTVPTIYTEPSERISYILEHYWDAFFAGSGLTDSSHVLGVPKAETEKSLATFIGILDMVPLPEAREKVERMFGRMTAQRQSDTSSTVWLLMSEMVSKYLYDPNSPLRDEDYYLPFVKLLSESPYTDEAMKPAFRYEFEDCKICQKGTIAPDFRIRDVRGRDFTLHSVKADYTMLFFSNPGCHACKGIIDEVEASEKIREMISDGRLAVVNVYIDEDLKAWREYQKAYPKTWKTGYDPAYVIRTDRLYNVRAIPSLYLLDKEKRIIFKDAPTEKVLGYLTR